MTSLTAVKCWASMKVRFSTVATRGFPFLPAQRFDQRFASQISKWQKVILKESLWDQGTWQGTLRKNPEYCVIAAIRKLRTDANCPAGKSWPNHVKNEQHILRRQAAFSFKVLCIIMFNCSLQEPITWSLHLPYKPLKSTLSVEKLLTEIAFVTL